MNVATILKHKGSEVAWVGPDANLAGSCPPAGREAESAPPWCWIPSLKILGIVSERDIVRALAAQGPACLQMPVASIMTSSVSTCRASDTIDQLMAQMTAGRFRHVPVVEDGRLLGIVSIGDVVKLKIAESELEVSAIRDYIAAH